MREAECPYCKEDVEINHDDGYGYEEGQTYQQQCGSCEKTFVYYTSIHFSYNEYEAPCLNDGEHNWTEIVSTLKGRERCSYCDEERIADKELYDKSMRGEV